jgi:hypothetical protein
VATFKNVGQNASIGAPVEFRKDNPRVGGLGGAGFSLCTIGVVVDGNATSYIPQLMALKFLDLQSSRHFSANPYGFNFVTPAGNASFNPRIFRSADGTIILVVTAANIGPGQLTAAFVDQVNSGRVIAQIAIAQVSGTIAAAISTNNVITFSFGPTTYPSIAIP